MKLDNNPTRLDFTNRVKRGTQESEMFRPDERKASAEALICLNCPLPAEKCRPSRCKRYDEEMKKIKENGND